MSRPLAARFVASNIILLLCQSEIALISLLTVLTPCMSRPLAARSVASNTSTSASLNFCNASNLWNHSLQISLRHSPFSSRWIFPKLIDRISMGYSIMCCKGLQVKSLNYHAFMSLKIVFILANSAYHGEILTNVAFHLGHHCLAKYLFTLKALSRMKRVKCCWQLFYVEFNIAFNNFSVISHSVQPLDNWA